MGPDAWFDQLQAALRSAAGDHPTSSTSPASLAVSADERAALLDLARVAAHTSERWTAPISTFLAGVAFASLGADGRAAAIRDLVGSLEDPDASSDADAATPSSG